VIRNRTPSAHGGVVSEPVYWRSGAVVSRAVSEVKSSGPVSVTVPGVAISARFLVTLVMRSVVLPSVVSWKRALRTATRLELSGALVSREFFLFYFLFFDIWFWGWGDGPVASCTMCISSGKYSSSIRCSDGVWKWNCFKA